MIGDVTTDAQPTTAVTAAATAQEGTRMPLATSPTGKSASAARPSPTGSRTGPPSQPIQATRCPAAREAREAGTAVTTNSVVMALTLWSSSKTMYYFCLLM
jgi:hypothetical protein